MAYDKKSFLSGLAAGRNMESWPAFEGSSVKAFIFKIDTSLESISSFSFSLTLAQNTVNIFWGDGATSQAVGGLNTHQYATYGEYYVILIGEFRAVSFRGSTIGLSCSKSLIAVLSPLPIAPGINQSVSLMGMFEDCQNLRIMPHRFLHGYYENAYTITSLEYTFRRCYSLQIPSDLFDGFVLAANQFSCESTFSNCYAFSTIPDGFLSSQAFTKCFSAQFMFTKSGITSVPDGLFQNFTGCGNYSQVFQNCESLQRVGTDVFPDVDLYFDFRSAFNGCTALQAIGSGLFYKVLHFVAFAHTFKDCVSLGRLPIDLFNYEMQSIEPANTLFLECFRNDGSITSAVPELWNYFPISSSSYNDCYNGCRSASNYNDIPANWR